MEIKLNLIPQYKKDEIQQGRHFRSLLGWEAELTFILACFILFLFSLSYILKINFSLVSGGFGTNPGSNAQMKEVENYDSEFKIANAKISEVEKIQRGQIDWLKLFEKINVVTSNEISINKLSTENYLVNLSGRAQTRDDLIAFKERLEKEECLENVALPLSNLVSKENVEFQINFNFKKDCLK